MKYLIYLQVDGSRSHTSKVTVRNNTSHLRHLTNKTTGNFWFPLFLCFPTRAFLHFGSHRKFSLPSHYIQTTNLTPKILFACVLKHGSPVIIYLTASAPHTCSLLVYSGICCWLQIHKFNSVQTQTL